jgi:hypothetical protein
MELRKNQRNSEDSSSGCKTRPAKEKPVQPEVSLAAAAARGSLMRRQANKRAAGSSLEKSDVPGAHGVLLPEGNSGVLAIGREGAAPGGVDECGAPEEDEPVTWETRVVLVHNPADGEPVILSARSACWVREQAQQPSQTVPQGNRRVSTSKGTARDDRSGVSTTARESEG